MRDMPAALIRALPAARDVERLADEHGGLLALCRAITATGALLLAGFDAGWRASELAEVLEFPAPAVRKRIGVARRAHADHPPAIVVSPPLPAELRPHPRAVLQLPHDERDWLTRDEAAAFAGVSRSTVNNWERAGLLPRMDRSAQPYLFWRDDLRRVMAAPRYNAVGVHYESLRAELGAE